MILVVDCITTTSKKNYYVYTLARKISACKVTADRAKLRAINSLKSEDFWKKTLNEPHLSLFLLIFDVVAVYNLLKFNFENHRNN